jgi:hypothetical protein
MGTPRIAEEDRLLPEELLEGSLEGEWVRVSAYAQGHRVSANGRDAYCGTILVYPEEWWDRMQAWAIKYSGYENRAKGPGKWSPTDYYIARDQRKGSQCAGCKGEDLMREDISTERETPTPVAGDTSPFGDPTPAERLQRQRFMTKVAWLSRELGATPESI